MKKFMTISKNRRTSALITLGFTLLVLLAATVGGISIRQEPKFITAAYMQIGDAQSCVSYEAIRKDVTMLVENNYTTVLPTDIQAWQSQPKSTPVKAAMLVFCCSDAQNCIDLVTMLQEYELRAVFVVHQTSSTQIMQTLTKTENQKRVCICIKPSVEPKTITESIAGIASLYTAGQPLYRAVDSLVLTRLQFCAQWGIDTTVCMLTNTINTELLKECHFEAVISIVNNKNDAGCRCEEGMLFISCVLRTEKAPLTL